MNYFCVLADAPRSTEWAHAAFVQLSDARLWAEQNTNRLDEYLVLDTNNNVL